jgi:hypothetical protein
VGSSPTGVIRSSTGRARKFPFSIIPRYYYFRRQLMTWFDEAIQLNVQGLNYAQIAEKLNVKYDAVKKRFNRYNRKLEGKDERRPLIEEFEDNYSITSGDYRVYIKKDKLREFKKLYCNDNPSTINEVCYKLILSRKDFNIIKTAFGITHDDVPFIDEDVIDRPVESLVEETLQQKKHDYFTSLSLKEVEQLKKEVDEYRKKDYYLNKVAKLTEEAFLSIGERKYIEPLSIVKSGKMLEVSIVDLHFGKLAWEPETGENYDYKIAEKRFLTVIQDIVNRTQDYQFEKIIIPIGNDFFNYDNTTNTTTLGTRQDTDLRWQKLYIKGVALLVNMVESFAKMAPVDVFVVPGNHDHLLSFCAINHLHAWFNNNPNVTIDTDPKTRKYREFGKCLIGFTHGDKEKRRIFGCMQSEVPQAWGRTEFREWHGAHLHSEQTKEDFGVIVRTLSSVTGIDSWHTELAFTGAIAKNQTFIWDKNNGLENILITTITERKK